MQVAILIHCDGFVVAYAEHSFGFTLVRKIDTDATILCLHIDESDMVILSHRMSHAANFHLNMTIIDTCHYREVFLHTCVNGVYSELLHLLAAAYYGNLRVYNFLDYITTMLAFEKFYCHNSY